MPERPGEATGVFARALRVLRPSHQHSALSASVLLMTAVMLSRVIGYLREAYIAYAFGAGPQTDAYVAAFTLPDWLNYIVAGGTASITFVSIYTRYVSQDRKVEAERAFSIIITVMSTVLLAGIVVAELLATEITRLIFPRFTAEQVELCAYLTRILLPAQLFFYVGGVVSAVLLSQRMFLFPALAPLLYNVFIILGGVLLAPQFGIASLAIGAVVGGFTGPFLVNAIGVARSGVRYRPAFDVNDPAFREWLRLSVPLMLGVSLVAADEWILRYFASGGAGDISRINYAKRLLAVPIAILGQAIGQASLPFFARLAGEKKMDEFARTVNRSVYRATAVSLLASAWCVACALPVVDLVYRRGRFTFGDSESTAAYFGIFAVSLAFWTAQALYARAFYAAGDTATPMIAGTAVTVLMLPVYALLFGRWGVMGLAVASNIGILTHTVVLAWLLARRRLVPLGGLDWGSLAKALLASVAAFAVAFAVARAVETDGTHWGNVLQLLLATAAWGATAVILLRAMGSDLLNLLRQGRAAA